MLILISLQLHALHSSFNSPNFLSHSRLHSEHLVPKLKSPFGALPRKFSDGILNFCIRSESHSDALLHALIAYIHHYLYILHRNPFREFQGFLRSPRYRTRNSRDWFDSILNSKHTELSDLFDQQVSKTCGLIRDLRLIVDRIVFSHYLDSQLCSMFRAILTFTGLHFI